MANGEADRPAVLMTFVVAERSHCLGRFGTTSGKVPRALESFAGHLQRLRAVLANKLAEIDAR